MKGYNVKHSTTNGEPYTTVATGVTKRINWDSTDFEPLSLCAGI
jgi:hypothetical protein